VCLALTLLLAAATLRPGAQPAHAAGAAAPTVYPFPIPGAADALPQTQIAFRGQIPAAGSVHVRGSQSGPHSGTIRADSDGHGGSFIPDAAFAAGEVVTVSTSMNIDGGQAGSYSFTVAQPAPAPVFVRRILARHIRGSVQRFRSRPDLAPAAIKIIKNSRHTARGDLFLAPQSSPVQDGPQIRDWRGHLIWYQQLPKNDYVSDFRVQEFNGQPVLTWWQGDVVDGVGYGSDVILDGRYRPIGAVGGEGGALPDLHEFLISRRNTALVTSYVPVFWSERSVRGPARAVVLDAIVQEIDINTGLLMFEWHALDHVTLRDSHKVRLKNPTKEWDYFHVNSIQELGDGNLLISARNTWATYKINRLTGAVIWSLGGAHSNFRMGRGTRFAFQHDAELRGGNIVSMFDDGAGPPTVEKHSRVLGLRLSFRHKTATRAFSWVHVPPLRSNFEGNAEELAGAHYFVGWGHQPYFSEFSAGGREIFDGRFVCDCFHDRAYRFRWSATPLSAPNVAVVGRGRKVTVYASWNGATSIGFWRVLEGRKPTRLRVVRRARFRNFETAIQVRGARFIAVVALDGSGHPISGSSPVVRG